MIRFPKRLILVMLLFVVVALAFGSVILFRIKSKQLQKAKVVPPPSLSEESTPTEIESNWEGKKTTLFQGNIISINQGNKITIRLENSDQKEIITDDKTGYSYLDLSALPPKNTTVESVDFWQQLGEGDKVSAACYDDGVAAFLAKNVTKP